MSQSKTRGCPMTKMLSALLFSFVFQQEAFAQDKFLSRLYRRIPERDALSLAGFPIERALKSSSVKALIWNIKKAEMKSWRSEFLKLGKGNDLFVIQEAYKNSLFDSTLNNFNHYHWSMGTSFLVKRDNNAPTGTMIGATVTPSEAIAKHSKDLEPIVLTPKAMTMVKYPVEGRSNDLLVISIHAINFQTTHAFKRHIDQAVSEIKNHEGPVLFAGDFNTWNKARMNFLFRTMKNLGLSEVQFKNAHLKMKFAGFPLDHSFVRGIKVKNAEVVASNGSDHKPLLMEFDVD